MEDILLELPDVGQRDEGAISSRQAGKQRETRVTPNGLFRTQGINSIHRVGVTGSLS